MSVRNLKDGNKKPWLCECYPQGRTGKRVRKRFATKGEAIAFEQFTMREVDDKPWLGDKPDHRRLSELLEVWWQVHGHTIKSGKTIHRKTALTIKELGDPIASTFTARHYLEFRASRQSHVSKHGVQSLSPISSKHKTIFVVQVSENNKEAKKLTLNYNLLLTSTKGDEQLALKGEHLTVEGDFYDKLVGIVE
jgi:hypothetical protein